MIEGTFVKATGRVKWLNQWYQFKGKTFVDITSPGMTQLNTLNDAIEWAAKDGIPVLYTNAGLFNGIKDDAGGLKTKLSSKVHLFVASYNTGTEPIMPMYFDKGSWRFWEYAPGKYRFKIDVLSQFEQYFVKVDGVDKPPTAEGQSGSKIKSITIPEIKINFEYYED